MQGQWIELGVKVNLNHVDYSVIEQARENGDWDGIIEAWDTFGDLYTGLSQEFSKDGSINYGKYYNPEVESLLNQLSQEGDSQRQNEIAKEINRMTAEDAPLIALMPRPSLYGKQKDVKGFEAHFMQFENVISNKLSVNSGN
ncbi:peptide/nickel transport system substrate-binding protein/oligopeptide transport system substrate-binding protein [Aerococcus urinaehominis]|nr:peptide/nickel transport system substrate-binding protein/oligopeptide transport system substrate-binding protein [Aerococcus urinaehominis]